MKSILLKLLFIFLVSIFMFYLFYSPSIKFDILENPAKDKVAHKTIKKTEQQSHKVKLTEGVGQYVGKSIDELTKAFGYPKRIYKSNYSYRNFIFTFKNQYYIVGVKDNTIKMIYATGKEANVYPYKIYSESGKIFNGGNVVSEPIISTKDGDYQFQLSEADIKTQALVEYENLFMQVFIDRFTNKVLAVRYLSPDTLVEMQPYALSYNGKTIERKINDEKHNIEEGVNNSNSVLTMFELTNLMRTLNDNLALSSNETINHIAQIQVMKLSQSNQKVTSVENEIGSQLNDEGIQFNHLTQNIAVNYEDIPALINSWMNSSEHREHMLDDQVNEMGGGISAQYNSIVFIDNQSLNEEQEVKS